MIKLKELVKEISGPDEPELFITPPGTPDEVVEVMHFISELLIKAGKRVKDNLMVQKDVSRDFPNLTIYSIYSQKVVSTGVANLLAFADPLKKWIYHSDKNVIACDSETELMKSIRRYVDSCI